MDLAAEQGDCRKAAFAQACAFYSPFSESLSASRFFAASTITAHLDRRIVLDSLVVATSAASKPIILSTSAYDRSFYSGMAIGMAVVVFIGFARTYYLSLYFGTAGTITGRPFTTIVRLHAALFTTWVLLFVVQTSLVARHRIAIHRRLGVAVATLGVMMIVVGTATALQLALRGGAPPGIDPRAFLAVPLGDMSVFALLLTAALWFRGDKEAHKRLMLLAYTAILVAAVARFPGMLLRGPLWFFGLTFLPVLALCTTYDIVTRRRVHPAYLWGGALLILSVPARLAISTTPAWHSAAEKLIEIAKLYS
jgi:hypothetical protein